MRDAKDIPLTNSASLPEIDALWDYGKPAESEQRFREILPQAERSGNPSYLLELLTQIARTHSLRRSFDESHAILDRVEQGLTPDLRRARVRYLLERGRAFNSALQPGKARPLFEEALELAQAAGEDNLAVDAAHMMGIVVPPEEQITWDLRAMEMAEKSADPKARNWLGTLYNNIGWSYHDMGRYEEALDAFQKGLKIRQERQEAVPSLLARYSVGRALRMLGRNEEALAIQQEVLAERDRRGEKAPYVYEELGELLLLKGQREEARGWFARAYAELSQDPWHAKNEPDRLSRMKELAGL